MAELTRRDRTILLLRSRHDWQPSVRSQFSSFGALPGEAATEWVECGRCNGFGTVPSRGGTEETCPKCVGARGSKVDAYTGRTDTERETKLFSAEDRDEWRRKLDQGIARMREQTEPPRSEADLIADATPYGWEIERDKHFKAGSYRELDQALEWLSARNSAARSLVGWVYESGAAELGCLDQSILRAADLAVELLAGRLPDPIKVPHWLLPRHPDAARKQAERSRAA